MSGKGFRLCWCAALAVSVLVSFNDAAQEAAVGGDSTAGALVADPRRRFLPTPAEENWGFLVDPVTRTDFFDPVKFVPFGTSDAAYASFGGAARVYVESIRHENFDAARGTNTYPEFRLLLHADLHLTDHLRLFAMTQTDVIGNRDGGPRPGVDQNELDLVEGFIEYDTSALDSLLRTPTVAIRVGRQQLDFGAGRLLSGREGPSGEGPNVLQGFDGARAIVREGLWRIDAFAAKPTDPTPGVFNDGWLAGQGVWGVYAERGAPPGAPGSGFDLYYIGTRRPGAAFFTGVADETRHSVGARAYRVAARWAYDVEIIYQTGDWGDRRIEAKGATAELSYTIEDWPCSPQPGLRVGVDSGGAGPTTLNTFYVPFPRGAYFGYLSAIGPENTTGAEAAITFHPLSGMTMTGGAFVFARQTPNDGLYALAGYPLLPPLTHQRGVGVQPIFSASWQASTHLIVNAALETFQRGDTIKAVPHTASEDYAALWATFDSEHM